MEPIDNPSSAQLTDPTRQLGTHQRAPSGATQSVSTTEDHPLKFVAVAILITVGALGLVWGLKGALPDAPPENPSAEAPKPPEPAPGSLEYAARSAVEGLVTHGNGRFRHMNLKIGERDRQELAKSPERQRETQATLVKLGEFQDKRARRDAEVKKLREEWRGASDEKEKNKALDDLVRAENGMREMTLDRLYVQLSPVSVFPWEIPATKGNAEGP